MKLYQKLATLMQALSNCHDSGNLEWATRHWEEIIRLVRDHMPSGSGFDNGVRLDMDRNLPLESKNKITRLVFTTSFHHMDDHGGYDGWTDHEVTILPSLLFGYEVHVSGRDKNGIKEYILDTFAFALMREVE